MLIAHDDLPQLKHKRRPRYRAAVPFSQEIMADVLGLGVADKDRLVTFTDLDALKMLAHYQPQELMPVPGAMAPA